MSVGDFLVHHILAVLSVVLLTQVSASQAKPKVRSDQVCLKGFDLQVAVKPAQGELADDAAGVIGIAVKYTDGSSRGLASRMHTSHKSEFTKERCQRWQKDFWPLVSMMKLEGKRAERAKMPCLNVGTIEFRSGARYEKTQVCLGDARKDNVSYAFRRFYDGTDGLVKR